MNAFIFTKFAEKKFYSLSPDVQQKILGKLQSLKKHDHIFSVLKHLIDFGEATHRLRIGQYRVILSCQKKSVFLILDVGHRKDIYQ